MNDMAPPNAAARLSEDIGDVLSAIRRLIAEDEALTAARDLRTHGSAATLIEHAEALPIAVGGDVLAQRHGGNAALARQIAGRSLSSVPEMRDAGRSADIQAAAMRAALQAPLSDIDDGADDEWFIAVESPLRAATKAAAAPAAGDVGPTASSAAHARLAGALEPADGGAQIPSLRSQIIVPRRDPVTPAAPPLRLGAAQRVVPTGDDAAGAARLHMPWRPWTPAPPRPLGAPQSQFRADGPAEKLGGPQGSRLSPVPLMRSLAEAADDDAPQGVSLAQPQGDGRAPIRRHHADADAAPIPPAPPPAVDFDALMAAMRADDVDHGWPDEPGDVLAGAAADDDAAGPASARADHPSVEDAVICPSATGTRSESRPAAKAPIVTGLDIDLMDEDEADLLIRKTIRAMIQEELHGELGERFSRNLRAVIRREIASAIKDQMDRL